MENFILSSFKWLIALQWILGSLLYVWTIYIAYQISGLFAAIITFFLPFIGQAYWGYQAWKVSKFESPFIQWILVLVVLFVLQKVIYGSVIMYENKKKRPPKAL